MEPWLDDMATRWLAIAYTPERPSKCIHGFHCKFAGRMDHLVKKLYGGFTGVKSSYHCLSYKVVLPGIHSNPSKIDLIAFLHVSFCTTSLSLPNRRSCEKRLLAGTITISKPHLECKRYTTRKRS
ncbi:hypothetical protein Fot_06882 [Forsythia ovata]|uniref:Uncharacterized protein n=1 Tax=Forsythia ovata TaxID=205694 RepID=A0ABD1WX48_9LAMI